MKLALHRSITFWSGILVMTFIGWAWRDSLANWSQFQMGDWALSNISGGILAESGTDPSGCSYWTGRTARPRDLRFPAFKGPNFERGDARDLTPDIREFLRKNSHIDVNDDTLLMISADLGLPQGPLDRTFGTMHYRSRGDWRLFIPHWLIHLTFAVPWLALLLWRARRRKRFSDPG